MSSRKRVRQPQYPVRVDSGNPLNSGSLSNLNFGAGLFDAVSGKPATVTSFGTAPTIAVGPGGKALQANADGGLMYSNTATLSSLAYTVTFCVELTSVDSPYGGFYSVSNSDATARFGLQRNSSGNDWAVYHNNSTFASVGGASAITNLIGSGKHVITVAHNGVAGGTLRYWLDGVLITDTTHANEPTAASSPRLVLFGERSGSATYSSGGKVYGFDLKGRMLSDVEVKKLHKNFWQIYNPITEDISVPSAGGGTLISLTAASLGLSPQAYQQRATANLGAAAMAFAAQAIQPKTTLGLAASTLNFAANTIQPRTLLTLGSAALSFTANAIAIGTQNVLSLTTAALGFVANSVQYKTTLSLGAAALSFVANSAAYTTTMSLGAAALGFTANAITVTQNRLIQLTAAVLAFTANAVTITGVVSSTINDFIVWARRRDRR